MQPVPTENVGFVSFEMAEESLDTMAPVARDLLHRVDLTLTQLGAPPDHPVLSLLRRLRVLPGQALDFALSASPQALVDAAAQLRQIRASYDSEVATPLDRVMAELGWSSAGQAAFTARWRSLMDHLAGQEGGRDSMAGRLLETAAYAESVAGWFSHLRYAICEALIPALSSEEAVVLRGCAALSGSAEEFRTALVSGAVSDTGRLARAGAEIGRVVLHAVAEIYEAGTEELLGGSDGTATASWSERLSELTYHGPALPDLNTGETGGTKVRL